MLSCPQCLHTNPRNSKFCEACGASLEKVAESTRIADEAEAEVMLLEVKKAQVALAIVAGLQVISAVLMLAFNMIDTVVMVVMLVIGALFFGLWVWAKKNPLAASIVGLVIFLTLHLADAIVDPSALLRGIIIKVIVVVILARAISAGVKHREFVRERGL